MKKKSDKNWKIGNELIDTEPNISANRIYYSVYQVICHFLRNSNNNNII